MDTLSTYFPNSTETFSCGECEKVLPNSTRLRSHKLTHVNPESVTCNICKKVFAHPASLVRHERIHTGNRPFKCPICTMGFTQGSHMTRHVKLIHNSGDKEKSKTVIGGECNVCGSSFKTAKSLEVHKKTHNPSKIQFHCEICAMGFENSSQLSIHRRQHTTPFVCKVCKKSFSSTSYLSVHAMIHSGKRPYSCEHCGQKFRQKGHVKRHQNTAHIRDGLNGLRESEPASANEKELPNSDENTNEMGHIPNPISTELHENGNQLEQLSTDRENFISRKNEVALCSNQIRQEPGPISVECKYSSENNQVELGQGKTINCEIATCEISEKSDKLHSGKTESLCENSEKSPNLEIGGADRQITAKPKVKANQCDICFKTFKQRSYVKSHKRTHTGEKPYSCACGKRYAFAHRLKSHRVSGKCQIELAESADREPVSCKCPHCNKVYKSYSMLKIHQKRHEKKARNSETFQCLFCSKKFSSKDRVDRHERVHTGHRPYQCNLCNKTFKQSAHVANHKKSVHGKGRRSCRTNTKKLASSPTESSQKRKNHKVYECEFCAKTFRRESQLLLHKKIHMSKMESFECQTCGKSFKNWNNLYRHELVHTGEKPFVCWVCGKACTQKSNLKSHINTVHGASDLVLMSVRSEVVSSSEQIHGIQTELSRVNGSTENASKEGDMLTRSAESQLGPTSQLCNEVDKDPKCTNKSPGLLRLHDKDTGLTQPRQRVHAERNLFTELKLRKRRHGKVDSTAEDQSNSNSKKYVSEVSDLNNNSKRKRQQQQQQQQQKESGFEEGNLLVKLDAEIARLSADFLHSDNVCNREQPFYQQPNTSLQGDSIAENESSSTRFETEAKTNSARSWHESAEVFENADTDKGDVDLEMFEGISQEKFEERQMSDEVEGRNEKMFVCCECGQRFDKENNMIVHCVNAH